MFPAQVQVPAGALRWGGSRLGCVRVRRAGCLVWLGPLGQLEQSRTADLARSTPPRAGTARTGPRRRAAKEGGRRRAKQGEEEKKHRLVHAGGAEREVLLCTGTDAHAQQRNSTFEGRGRQPPRPHGRRGAVVGTGRSRGERDKQTSPAAWVGGRVCVRRLPRKLPAAAQIQKGPARPPRIVMDRGVETIHRREEEEPPAAAEPALPPGLIGAGCCFSCEFVEHGCQ
jgi:hypothetical protein